MDDKILIAIISAGSAIVGGLVPAIFTFFAKKKELESNLKILKEQHSINQDNTHKEIRRLEYAKFIEALQKERNTQNNFSNLQDCVNRILLFADDNTASLINEYYTAICFGVMKREPLLNANQHDKYQKDIINSMRNDLGVSSKELDNILLATYSK